ncbi:type 1 glutamine amidotransferase family protein [Azohydromonas caseinilytica]|uniref:Glutamine amidotransferase n=1 Tax=Azohydromonas caseinilytica TaxID=2728836 RepID=A0A848F969_9BURK|nr:type 1 glutamine amidotransferase family protein [Azohydromonas caseinilytica]NML15892.1 glutamine amidotransferase [Azohydromonas caseinilytica]
MEDLATAAAAAAEADAAGPVRTVHLYVFDGFADWEAAFAVAGIHNPQFQREPGRWQVKTVGAGRHAVPRSMGGVSVMPDLGLDDLQPEHSAMLILPGGVGWADDVSHHGAIAKAGQFLRRGVPVAAICGATAALARAGWLESRPHTSNALAYLKGTGYGGADFYQDEPAVRDHGLITAGGMAPIEFAREIFAELGLYEDEALQAWVQLYKTGKSEYFARLARAAAPRAPAEAGAAGASC